MLPLLHIDYLCLKLSMVNFRYFIKMAYNGTSFHGWQIQPNAFTVQESLNKAISLLTGREINVVGAGRTDTGVHAALFYAHFELNYMLDEKACRQLCFKLNRFLSSDIVVYNIFPVRSDAHTRFDAISRTYKYFIHQYKDPFVGDLSWYHYGSLNMEAMNDAARLLFDYIDFTSFSKSGTQTSTNNCKITEAYWRAVESKKMVFTITADRFLRNMVRAIVGTLLEVGQEKMSVEQFRMVIESKNRSNAGLSVPAQGLFLYDIKYPSQIYM